MMPEVNASEGATDEVGDDTSGLIDFISSVAGESHLKVEENLGDGYVRLRIAEAERRQAKHDIRCVEDIVIEMLRNARDAHATMVFLATTREENTRRITMIDNGDGIPAHMHKLIFEPRVTSKLDTMISDRWGVHGRGMALYSIKENARSVEVSSSAEGLGSALHIEVDLEQLPERTDQSTVPQLVLDDEGRRRIARGPHNIIRNVLEFSLEDPGVDVYMGSSNEIASTLRHLGSKSLDDEDLLFCDDLDTLPVCMRPAACDDAPEFASVCASIGLDLSERSAHRIFAGEIRPLRPAISGLLATSSKSSKPEPDIYRDRRGLKLTEEDSDAFARRLESAFEDIAGKYYVSLRSVPHITITHDSIRVRFDVEKDD